MLPLSKGTASLLGGRCKPTTTCKPTNALKQPHLLGKPTRPVKQSLRRETGATTPSRYAEHSPHSTHSHTHTSTCTHAVSTLSRSALLLKLTCVDGVWMMPCTLSCAIRQHWSSDPQIKSLASTHTLHTRTLSSTYARKLAHASKAHDMQRVMCLDGGACAHTDVRCVECLHALTHS